MAEFRWIVMSSFLMLQVFSSRVTEHNDTDEVTLICSVSSYGGCRHTVKWLLQGQDVDKDHKDLKTSTSSCRASLMFLTSHDVYTSRYKTVKCEVTEGDKVKQFPFNIRPSGEKKGDAATTTTTTSPTTTLSPSTTRNKSGVTNNKTSENNRNVKKPEGWWRFIVVPVGLAALIISVVTVNVWTRTHVNKTRMNGNIVFSSRVATGQLSPSFTVRDGDEVTLPCNNVLEDHKNCDTTTWNFGHSRSRAVALVKDGKIGETAKAKSDRLSVSENCSLVIKNVTDEDVGLYVCRQFRSGPQEGPDAVVLLSVVTMTEHKDTDEVTLNCSVSSNEGCRHTVKWLLQGLYVDKDHKDLKTSTSPCRASLMFLTSHYVYTSRDKTVKCEVTEGDKVKQFPFNIWPSGEKKGDAATTTTTTSPTTTLSTSTTRNKSGVTNNKTSENNRNVKKPEGWWRFIVVPVGLAALIISVVTVNVWTRTHVNKTRMNGNIERNDEDDDDGTVNYENVGDPSASVSLH
ncbi:uncharacterized protein LOC129107542 [Anoplopoma fimbria]|uniref:uncharacterized protein LOC129107542 n=1 Tax=Anoplopoma fimbria TaxID=229290 RepID=UPI0023ED9368|nr:uncharacterized protein LOC129107542 [Anoplopoma fimbria]